MPNDIPDWTDKTVITTTGDVTVTGTVEVTTKATEPLDITGPVSITGTPTVDVASGTVKITGPVGLVTGTSVAITGTPTVDINGTPTVEIAAGQVVQVENTSGGSVTVAGTVAVSGTTAVEITGTPTVDISAGQVVQVESKPTSSVTVAGSIDIANTPAVTVSGDVTLAANQLVQVENKTGGSLTVAGTIDIGNTPSVTVTGAPDVKITGTPTVEIAAGQVVQVENTSGGSVTVAGSIDIASGTVDIGTVTGAVSVTNTANEVLQVGSAMDYLGFATGSGGGTVIAKSVTVPAGKRYVAVAAKCSPRPGATHAPYCVQLFTGTVNDTTAVSFCAPMGPAVAPTPVSGRQAIVPAEVSAGGAFTVRVYFPSTVGATTVVYLFGLTVAPPGLLLRPDGRAYPVGGHAVSVLAAASGSTTVVAAPASPLRIMLKDLAIAENGASQFDTFLATLGGSFLVLAGCHGSGLWRSWPDGLLLDPATAVVATQSGATDTRYNVVYDLVV